MLMVDIKGNFQMVWSMVMEFITITQNYVMKDIMWMIRNKVKESCLILIIHWLIKVFLRMDYQTVKEWQQLKEE